MKGILDSVKVVQSKITPFHKPLTPIVKGSSFLSQNDHLNHSKLYSPQRQSLSPLRWKKKNRLQDSLKSYIGNKENGFNCENHQEKEANYKVESQFEAMYYCKNCAVRLASQGFEIELISQKSCSKINEKNEFRTEEINRFMKSLQPLIKNLTQKKTQLNRLITKSHEDFEIQMGRIKQYYSRFHEIIEEHQNRVIAEYKREYKHITDNFFSFAKEVEEALHHSQLIKKDISQSINEVIMKTSDVQFRPIMNYYTNKLKEFLRLSELEVNQKDIQIKSLVFKEADRIKELLEENMEIAWGEQSQILMKGQNTSFEQLLQSDKENVQPSLSIDF